MLRILLIVGAVIGSALLMPTALLGILIGFDGLRRPVQVPGVSGLWLIAWLIDLTYLFLGLGGVLGFFALLVAELAPFVVKRAGGLCRLALLIGLAWGSIAALAVGILGTLSNSYGSTQPALSLVTGPALIALALVGLSSWWRTKRGA